MPPGFESADRKALRKSGMRLADDAIQVMSNPKAERPSVSDTVIVPGLGRKPRKPTTLA